MTFIVHVEISLACLDGGKKFSGKYPCVYAFSCISLFSLFYIYIYAYINTHFLILFNTFWKFLLGVSILHLFYPVLQNSHLKYVD